MLLKVMYCSVLKSKLMHYPFLLLIYGFLLKMKVKSYLWRLGALVCLDYPDENLIFCRILKYIKKKLIVLGYTMRGKKSKYPVITFSLQQSIKTVYLLTSCTVLYCQVMPSKEESSS